MRSGWARVGNASRAIVMASSDLANDVCPVPPGLVPLPKQYFPFVLVWNGRSVERFQNMTLDVRRSRSIALVAIAATRVCPRPPPGCKQKMAASESSIGQTDRPIEKSKFERGGSPLIEPLTTGARAFSCRVCRTARCPVPVFRIECSFHAIVAPSAIQCDCFGVLTRWLLVIVTCVYHKYGGIANNRAGHDAQSKQQDSAVLGVSYRREKEKEIEACYPDTKRFE